jgi:hypothetical protein
VPPAARRKRAGARPGALSKDLRTALRAEVARLAALEPAEARLTAVGDTFAALDRELAAVADVRLAAIAELRAQGATYTQLVTLSGLSRSRIGQLTEDARRRKGAPQGQA